MAQTEIMVSRKICVCGRPDAFFPCRSFTRGGNKPLITRESIAQLHWPCNYIHFLQSLDLRSAPKARPQGPRLSVLDQGSR